MGLGYEAGRKLRRTFKLPGASLHVPARTFSVPFPSWCHQSALDLVKVAEPVRIRPREPHLTINIMHKAKKPSPWFAIPDYPVRQRCRDQRHFRSAKRTLLRRSEAQSIRGACPILVIMEVEPDKRAGAVSKTECASRGKGSMPSDFRHFLHASVAQKTRAPRFERGGCGCKSCRKHHSMK